MSHKVVVLFSKDLSQPNTLVATHEHRRSVRVLGMRRDDVHSVSLSVFHI